MNIYFTMAMITDGENSGPEHDQLWTEFMIFGLGVGSLHFRYFGEEKSPNPVDPDYKRMTRLFTKIKKR